MTNHFSLARFLLWIPPLGAVKIYAQNCLQAPAE